VAIVTAERAACCGASAGALNAKEAADSDVDLLETQE